MNQFIPRAHLLEEIEHEKMGYIRQLITDALREKQTIILHKEEHPNVNWTLLFKECKQAGYMVTESYNPKTDITSVGISI